MPKDEEFRNRAAFVLLLTTAFGLALTFLWIGRVIFLLLFASIIGAVFLSAVAEWIHNRFKIKTGVALSGFILVAFAVIALLIWIQGPNAALQFADLETELPAAARQLLAQMQSHQWGQWILHQTPGADQISSGFSFAISHIGGIVVSSATVLAGVLIVFILSIYFASEPGIYYAGLRHVTPIHHRPKLDACAASVVKILRSWVLAKLISMAMVGILISIGLWIVGVPLAGTLGIIAALMTFIPNVGPIISVIPAALLALAKNPTTGLLAILVFAIVFTLEGYLVTPLLERNIVRLPPALTLIMQLLLAAIAGPVGVALAAPIAAAILGILSVLVPEDTTDPDDPSVVDARLRIAAGQPLSR
ncbi:AI-2E family transporter [Acidicapsa ligni]|uniref:AI-2E family transporter n=1 Tax=Acidicapsa ligni TaxID=542300 RepID=UPI0021E0345E|nr:AI-2E family transporter [Acidicapsa ligni]